MIKKFMPVLKKEEYKPIVSFSEFQPLLEPGAVSNVKSDREARIEKKLGCHEISREDFERVMMPVLDRYVKERFKKRLDACTDLEKAEAVYEAVKGEYKTGNAGVIRKGGLLGIKLQLVEERESEGPFTASEALKNRRGDCDELSLLFIAVAKQLGVENVGLVVVRWDVVAGIEEGHACALTTKEGESVVIDPSMHIFEKFGRHGVRNAGKKENLEQNLEFKEFLRDRWSNVFKRDEGTGIREVVRINIVTEERGYESIHCSEMAEYLNRKIDGELKKGNISVEDYLHEATAKAKEALELNGENVNARTNLFGIYLNWIKYCYKLNDLHKLNYFVDEALKQRNYLDGVKNVGVYLNTADIHFQTGQEKLREGQTNEAYARFENAIKELELGLVVCIKSIEQNNSEPLKELPSRLREFVQKSTLNAYNQEIEMCLKIAACYQVMGKENDAHDWAVKSYGLEKEKLDFEKRFSR
ncbi:MAG: hypothetical protein ABIH99_04280 [Candidatus Micrarchaeota archaeon]